MVVQYKLWALGLIKLQYQYSSVYFLVIALKIGTYHLFWNYTFTLTMTSKFISCDTLLYTVTSVDFIHFGNAPFLISPVSINANFIVQILRITPSSSALFTYSYIAQKEFCCFRRRMWTYLFTMVFPETAFL
jgi:hypothetical protein